MKYTFIYLMAASMSSALSNIADNTASLGPDIIIPAQCLDKKIPAGACSRVAYVMNRAHRDLAALARLQEKLMSWLFCVHADQPFKAINPVCYLGVVVPRMAVAGVQCV